MRSATKSRSTVANSALVLRRPTSPPTAGRNPEASPPSCDSTRSTRTQLKSWPEREGGALAIDAREARDSILLDDVETAELRKFFELLDQWWGR